MPAEPIIHETTWAERSTWGECPACHAKHGERCNPGVGFSLGVTARGLPPSDGVHLSRLKAAPMKIELRPVL